jgi:hypothetical protein
MAKSVAGESAPTESAVIAFVASPVETCAQVPPRSVLRHTPPLLPPPPSLAV